jgi:hypothetical protein
MAHRKTTGDTDKANQRPEGQENGTFPLEKEMDEYTDTCLLRGPSNLVLI